MAGTSRQPWNPDTQTGQVKLQVEIMHVLKLLVVSKHLSMNAITTIDSNLSTCGPAFYRHERVFIIKRNTPSTT